MKPMLDPKRDLAGATPSSGVKYVIPNAERFRADLHVLSERYGLAVKGRGMMLGLDFRTTENAAKVKTGCFESGLILETSGPHDEVLKILPPLTVANDVWNRAVVILEGAIEDVLN